MGTEGCGKWGGGLWCGRGGKQEFTATAPPLYSGYVLGLMGSPRPRLTAKCDTGVDLTYI